jgi:hypothetical protein
MVMVDLITGKDIFLSTMKASAMIIDIFPAWESFQKFDSADANRLEISIHINSPIYSIKVKKSPANEG